MNPINTLTAANHGGRPTPNDNAESDDQEKAQDPGAETREQEEITAERTERILAELEAEKEKSFQKDLQKANEAWLIDLEKEENSIVLWDPAERKKQTYAQCKRKYGRKMADKMLKAKKENGGRFSNEDYGEIMRLHEKKSRPPEDAPKKPTKKEPFIKLEHKIIRSEKVRKVLKKSMMLYLYLLAYVVRKKFEADHLNLYDRYYRKGKLAASMSIRKLAADCFMDQKTVAGYLRELSDNNVIVIEKVPAQEAYDNQDHNVYVLGRHESGSDEIYYIQELIDSDR